MHLPVVCYYRQCSTGEYVKSNVVIEILLANSSYKYCTPLTDDSVSVFIEGKAELCNLSNSLVTVIHWEEHENAIISLWKMLGL